MYLPLRISVATLLFVALGLSAGCASSDDDNILVRAGFDALKANTTDQVSLINKLNPYQIFVLHKDGRTFYAFPDPVHTQIYVGTEQDMARYRKLRAGQNARLREAELPMVENQGSPILNAWSQWPGWNA